MSKTYKICIAFILITLFYNNTSNAIIISEISYENKYNHLSKPVVAISPEANYVLIGNQVQEKIFFASNTGKILWEKELPPGIEMESGDISIDGDVIVIGGQCAASEQNYVFAYLKNGLLFWKESAYGEIPVFISDNSDMIYFADNNKILKCYNRLGVPEWSQVIDTKGQKIFKITTSENGEKILLLLHKSIIFCDKNGNELDRLSPTPFDGCINIDGSILALLYSSNSKKYLGLFDIENSYKIIFEKEILDYGSVSMDEFNNIYLTVINDKNYLYDIDGNLIQSWINGGYNIAVSKMERN